MEVSQIEAGHQFETSVGNYRVIKPIAIDVQEVNGEFQVTAPLLGLLTPGSGSTAREAIQDLLSTCAINHKDLNAEGDRVVGAAMFAREELNEHIALDM